MKSPITCGPRNLSLAIVLSCHAAASAMAEPVGDTSNPNSWRTEEFFAQYGLGWIGAEYAYTRGIDGTGIKVGVVDTGLSTDHPEFKGRYATGITFDPSRPWDFDHNGHGSAVAAVIAANRDGSGMHGVAPGATIVQVNASGNNGPGSISSAAATFGIDNLVAQGVRIINNSYGVPIAPTEVSAEEVTEVWSAYLATYRKVVDSGALLIWASGNDGVEQSHLEAGLPYLFPELERGWLAVTGYGYDYANQCGVAKRWCLAAPAAEIFTVDSTGGFKPLSGTSFAAPHVAGAAALVAQMFPYMSMEQVRQILLGTAYDVGDPGIDDVYGYGFLDVSAAVYGPGKFDWGDFEARQSSGISYWGNNISGDGGLTKSGGGTLVLLGSNSYRGPTYVDEGFFVVQKSIASDTFIAAGGILGGTGIVHGDVDNGGAVYGGYGRWGGTLTINGDLTQQEGGSFTVMLDAPDGTSRVDVLGTASVAGYVSASLFGGYNGDARHTILRAAQLTGALDGVREDYAFLDMMLSYEPGEIYLDVARNDIGFDAVGTTANQRATGAGLESIGSRPVARLAATASAPSLYNLIAGLTAPQAQAAFDNLSGEIHPDVRTQLFDESRFVRNALSGRLSALGGDAADRSVWTEGYGAWSEESGNGNAAGFDANSRGVIFGADGEVNSSFLMGLAGGYGTSSLKLAERASTASIDSYTAAAYAATSGLPVQVSFGAAHSWHSIETRRSISLVPETASVSYDARTTQVFAEINSRFENGLGAVEPFAGLAYVHVATDGFSESGVTGLSGRNDSDDAGYVSLGLRAETTLNGAESATVKARANVAWQHLLGGTSTSSVLNFTGGSVFEVAGLPLSRDVFAADLGLAAHFAGNASLSLTYAGRFGSDARSHGVNGRLDWKF